MNENPSRLKILVYFLIFSVLSGLSYQMIQDRMRPGLSAEAPEWLVYALGVAPNFLGGVSLAAGFIVVARELVEMNDRRLSDLMATGLATASLVLWEILQIWLPNGFFDAHDIFWTFPGAALAFIAARSMLGAPAPNRDVGA